jgi:hypothetical protein
MTERCEVAARSQRNGAVLDPARDGYEREESDPRGRACGKRRSGTEGSREGQGTAKEQEGPETVTAR